MRRATPVFWQSLISKGHFLLKTGSVENSVLRCPSQRHSPAPWHFLNFLPEPQGHGSLRPTLTPERTTCWTGACSAPPPAILACWSSRFFLRWNSCSISSTDVETLRGRLPLDEGRAGRSWGDDSGAAP